MPAITSAITLNNNETAYTKALNAIKEDNLEKLIQIVSLNETIVLEMDVNQNTLLHHALLEFENHPPYVHKESRNQLGSHEFHEGDIINPIQIIEFLIKCGAKINARNSYGTTPLHLAVNIKPELDLFYDFRSSKRMQQFLPKNTSSECVFKFTRDLDVLSPLIRAGAKVDAADNKGIAPLHLAAATNHVTAISLLVKNGAFVDYVTESGVTPLHWAAMQGHKEAYETLLFYKADIFACAYPSAANLIGKDPQSAKGKLTALHFAIEKNDADIIEISFNHLKTLGYKNTLRNVFATNGSSALHVLSASGKVSSFKELVSIGCSPHISNENGYTPLHVASEAGHKEIIEYLIDEYPKTRAWHQAIFSSDHSLEVKTKEGKTAWNLAMDVNNTSIAKLLEERGAKQNVVIAKKKGILSTVGSIVNNQTKFVAELEQLPIYKILNNTKIFCSSLYSLPAGPVAVGMKFAEQAVLYGSPGITNLSEGLYYRIKPTLHNKMHWSVEYGVDMLASMASVSSQVFFTSMQMYNYVCNPTRRLSGLCVSYLLANLASTYTNDKNLQAVALFLGREAGMFMVDAVNVYQRDKALEGLSPEIDPLLNQSMTIWGSLVGKQNGEAFASAVHSCMQLQNSIYYVVGKFEADLADSVMSGLTEANRILGNFKTYSALCDVLATGVDLLSPTQAYFATPMMLFSKARKLKNDASFLRDRLLWEIEHAILDNLIPDSDYRTYAKYYLAEILFSLKSNRLYDAKIDLNTASQTKDDAEIVLKDLIEKEEIILKDPNATEYEKTTATNARIAAQYAFDVANQALSDAKVRAYQLETDLKEQEERLETAWKQTPKYIKGSALQTLEHKSFTNQLEIEQFQLVHDFHPGEVANRAIAEYGINNPNAVANFCIGMMIMKGVVSVDDAEKNIKPILMAVFEENNPERLLGIVLNNVWVQQYSTFKENNEPRINIIIDEQKVVKTDTENARKEFYEVCTSIEQQKHEKGDRERVGLNADRVAEWKKDIKQEEIRGAHRFVGTCEYYDQVRLRHDARVIRDSAQIALDVLNQKGGSSEEIKCAQQALDDANKALLVCDDNVNKAYENLVKHLTPDEVKTLSESIEKQTDSYESYMKEWRTGEFTKQFAFNDLIAANRNNILASHQLNDSYNKLNMANKLYEDNQDLLYRLDHHGNLDVIGIVETAVSDPNIKTPQQKANFVIDRIAATGVISKEAASNRMYDTFRNVFEKGGQHVRKHLMERINEQWKLLFTDYRGQVAEEGKQLKKNRDDAQKQYDADLKNYNTVHELTDQKYKSYTSLLSEDSRIPFEKEWTLLKDEQYFNDWHEIHPTEAVQQTLVFIGQPQMLHDIGFYWNKHLDRPQMITASAINTSQFLISYKYLFLPDVSPQDKSEESKKMARLLDGDNYTVENIEKLKLSIDGDIADGIIKTATQHAVSHYGSSDSAEANKYIKEDVFQTLLRGFNFVKDVQIDFIKIGDASLPEVLRNSNGLNFDLRSIIMMALSQNPLSISLQDAGEWQAIEMPPEFAPIIRKKRGFWRNLGKNIVDDLSEDLGFRKGNNGISVAISTSGEVSVSLLSQQQPITVYHSKPQPNFIPGFSIPAPTETPNNMNRSNGKENSFIYSPPSTETVLEWNKTLIHAPQFSVPQMQKEGTSYKGWELFSQVPALNSVLTPAEFNMVPNRPASAAAMTQGAPHSRQSVLPMEFYIPSLTVLPVSNNNLPRTSAPYEVQNPKNETVIPLRAPTQTEQIGDVYNNPTLKPLVNPNSNGAQRVEQTNPLVVPKEAPPAVPATPKQPSFNMVNPQNNLKETPHVDNLLGTLSWHLETPSVLSEQNTFNMVVNAGNDQQGVGKNIENSGSWFSLFSRALKGERTPEVLAWQKANRDKMPKVAKTTDAIGAARDYFDKPIADLHKALQNGLDNKIAELEMELQDPEIGFDEKLAAYFEIEGIHAVEKFVSSFTPGTIEEAIICGAMSGFGFVASAGAKFVNSARGAIVTSFENYRKPITLGGNPFKGMSHDQIGRILEKRGFDIKGNSPRTGGGSYEHPISGRKYYMDKGDVHRYADGIEHPHVDVHRMFRSFKDVNGPKKNIEAEKQIPAESNITTAKRKYPLGDKLYEQHKNKP